MICPLHQCIANRPAHAIPVQMHQNAHQAMHNQKALLRIDWQCGGHDAGFNRRLVGWMGGLLMVTYTSAGVTIVSTIATKMTLVLVKSL